MNPTQLSDFNNYDTKNVLFSKCEIGNIPNQKITFKRIRIATRNHDQTIGDLIFSTPPGLMSFGLQETRDLVTNQINGYVFPICLWNQHGCSPEEKAFTDMFNSITEHCKNYLLEHRDEIEKYDLDASDLKKFNPLFWKMEKGKIVEGRGPMLYVKVMYNKRNDHITSLFIDENTNEELDPFQLLNKRCYVTAAIKFESIFIGNKISLQVKLYEAVVKVVDNSIRGLLRPNAVKRVAVEAPMLEPIEARLLDEEEEEPVSHTDTGSLIDEHDTANDPDATELTAIQQYDAPPQPPPTTVVEDKKKRVSKKTR